VEEQNKSSLNFTPILESPIPRTLIPEPSRGDLITAVELSPMVMKETATKGQHSARQLYSYWINCPLPLDNEVYRQLYASEYLRIQDLDNQSARSYFDVLPELDYSSGGTTKAHALSALVGAAVSRFHAAHYFVGLLANTIIWAQLKGFAISTRLSTYLRWGKLNGLTGILKGMPLNPSWVSYIISQQRILIANQLHHGIGVALPIYIPFQDNWVEYSRGTRDDAPAWNSSRTIKGTAPTRRIPTIFEGVDTISSFGSYKEDTDQQGFPNMSGYSGSGSAGANYGIIAAYLYDRLTAIVSAIQTNFSDMLDPTHPIVDYLVQRFGCSSKFDAAEISEMTRAVSPVDAKSFIEKYMMYGSELQPFRNLEGTSDGFLGSTIPDEDAYTTPQAFSLGDDPYAWYVTKARGQSQYLGMSATVSGVDQLDAIKAGSFSFVSQFRTDKTKLTLLTPKDLSSPASWGSWDGGTTYGYDRGLGMLCSVLDLAYYSRPGYFQTKNGIKDFIARFEEKGNKLFIIPTELQAGKLIFHSLFRPHINTWDLQQCGFCKVISYDDITDDPWSKWLTAADATAFDSAQSEDAGTGLWESSDTRAALKDLLVPIGDGFMSSPNLHFTRKDLGILVTESAANLGMSKLPLRPFSQWLGHSRRTFNYYLSTTTQDQNFANVDFTAAGWLFETADTPFTINTVNTKSNADSLALNPWFTYQDVRPYPIVHFGFWDHFEALYQSVSEILKSVPMPSPIDASAAEITQATRSLLDIEFLKRATGEGDKRGRNGHNQRTSGKGRSNRRGKSSRRPKFDRPAQDPKLPDATTRTSRTEFKPDELSETTDPSNPK
jgi:hypothetical protein